MASEEFSNKLNEVGKEKEPTPDKFEKFYEKHLTIEEIKKAMMEMFPERFI